MPPRTPSNPSSSLPFVFFGTPVFAAIILDELAAQGFLPSLIVTAPDKPQGRKLLLTPTPVKVWGEARQIPVITPPTLKDDTIAKILSTTPADVFVVAAYGKIIPKHILEIPKLGTLNVHPSLLPKFRGPSPIESVILSDETETGVSIMLLDEEMDHGPIVAQRPHYTPVWPPKGSELTDTLAHEGGALLAEILRTWGKEQHSTPQEHSLATYTKKIVKEDGLIELTGDTRANFKKIRAFDEWPGAYFFLEHNGRPLRVKVTDATIENEQLIITRVIPEGKKEMFYEDFLKGIR